MSRIFKRPMFRKGGNVGEGIMTGIVDRENYQLGTSDVEAAELGFGNFGNFGQGTRSAEELGYDFNFAIPTFKRAPNQSLEDLQKQYSKSLLDAAGERDSFDPLTKFLLTYGPAAAIQTGGGGTLGNLLAAGKVPVENLIKDRELEDRFKRDIRLKSAGAAIETKKEQESQAMEIENKLEALKADVINKGKELQNKIYANKELTDAERDNLLTRLANERQLAIEKIELSAAKQLKLEQFKLDNEQDGLIKAAKEGIFLEQLKNYSDNVEVATRATNFKVNASGELYKKVGSQAGGVLTFDINDENARKQNKKALRELKGQIVYDPYADKYHKILKDDFKTFGSTIDSIPIDEDDTTNTGSNTDDDNKKLKLSNIGTKETPNITQIDPESSEFAQDIQKLFANSDFDTLFRKIGQRAATGYGDALAGSPAGKIYGYFFDNPKQAKERSKSAEASSWFRSNEARNYFIKNPDQLSEAAIDPTGWYKKFKS